MGKAILTLLMIFLAPFLKAESDDCFVGASERTTYLNQTTSFSRQLPKVNVVSGEYCEEACDYVLAGAEPLSIRRFYHHFSPGDLAFGHWRLNPESEMNFNCTSYFPNFVGVGTENGGFIKCTQQEGIRFTFAASDIARYSNGGELTGQNHPANLSVQAKIGNGINDKHTYHVTVLDGAGRKRVYETEKGTWKNFKEVPSFERYTLKETQPNGNVIHYTFEDYNYKITNRKEVKKGMGHRIDTHYIPSRIEAYSSTGFFLGSIDFSYENSFKQDWSDSYKKRFVASTTISGSDGRSFVYHNQDRKVKGKKGRRLDINRVPSKRDSVMHRTEIPWKPEEKFVVNYRKASEYFQNNHLAHIEGPDRGRFCTNYDPETKKVTEQLAPSGADGMGYPIARYEYHDEHTFVYDGEGGKTGYFYDETYRVNAIMNFLGDKTYSVERYLWSDTTGNLIKKSLEDASGKILQTTEFEYDEQHNATKVVSRCKGDERRIDRTYTQDGFNLLASESDRPWKRIFYTYVEGTNLPKTEFTYVDDKICRRTFYFYDEVIPSVATRIVQDDGSSEDVDDLRGVTCRKITEMTLRYEQPCVGLPEIVEEKTIDEQGSEISLGSVHYTYHPSGKVEAESHYDAMGAYRFTLQKTYDKKELLVSETDPLGRKTTYAYDNCFNLIEQKGPAPGMLKKWTYDFLKRPIEICENCLKNESLKTTHTYDRADRLVATTDPCGALTRYEYDSLGRCIATHHPDGAKTRCEYDLFNNVVKEVDPLGYETRTDYNGFGQKTAIYHPDGSEEFFTYNDLGQLIQQTSPSGAVTRITYDAFDRPTSKRVVSSAGKLLKESTYTYSAFHLLSESHMDGPTTFYTYDFSGRKTSETREGDTTRYYYDELGRCIEVERADTIVCTDYDLGGQVISKRTLDPDRRVLLRVEYAYDEAGNQTEVITTKGIMKTDYNAQKLPVKRVDPLGNVTSYRYDYTEAGLVTTEINPKGIGSVSHNNLRGKVAHFFKHDRSGNTLLQIDYTYDLALNCTSETLHLYDGTTFLKTQANRWTYGPGGQIKTLIESDEKKTEHLYDERGRLSLKIKPDASELHYEYDSLGRLVRYFSHDFDYHYTFDAGDRPIEVKDHVTRATTSRSYDALGNLTWERLANGLEMRYSYNPQGQRLECVLSDGSSIDYTYYGGRLESVSRGEYTHTYEKRDLEGRLTLSTLPLDLGSYRIKRDALSRPAQIDAPGYRASCRFDECGNLSDYSFTDSIDTWSGTYRYDSLDQLISERDHSYRHDSLHNRLSKDHAEHETNALNQILSDGAHLYSYDSNGNLLSDGDHDYAYDSQDRLISVTTSGEVTEYTYDPFHRRMSKRGKKTTYYLWDGNNEIGSTRKRGKLEELRVLGEGLGAEIGATTLIEIRGKVYIPIHDYRGSVVTLLDPKRGSIKGTYRYTAFGEEMTRGERIPWRFSSKRVDPETDYIYFGRRYYRPHLGRWITPDPEGFADGPNLYAYVKNNPLAYCDPYGLAGESSQEGGQPGWIRRQLHPIFKGMYLGGKHAILVPGLRDVYEAVGRWGMGGKFFERSDYLKNYARFETIPGKQPSTDIFSITCGLNTSYKEAKEAALAVSESYGGVEVHMHYPGSRGFVTDLLYAGFQKIGWSTNFEKNTASRVERLMDGNDKRMTYWVHSVGAQRLKNMGKFMEPSLRDRIDVNAAGPATCIPDKYFGSATSFMSAMDPIIFANFYSLSSPDSNITFLNPHTNNMLTEHSFLGPTYRSALENIGKKYRESH